MRDVALEIRSLSQCAASDPSLDGRATIDELVIAVNNALDGVPRDCAALPTPRAAQAALGIVSRSGAQGQTIGIDVSLTISDDEVVIRGTQNDIVIPAGLEFLADGERPDCDSAAISNAGFSFRPAGCTPGVSCTSVRAIATSFFDDAPIPSGTILYTCMARVAADAALGSLPIQVTDVLASDANGAQLLIGGNNGSLDIQPQPPTDTPSADTPTPTPTVTPSPTPTHTPLPGSVTTITGMCRQPGPNGLEPCALRTEITVFRCIDLGCVMQQVVGTGLVDAAGAYRIFVIEDVLHARLIVSAAIGASAALSGGESPGGTTYRVIDVGSGEERGPSLISPASEAAVRLLEEGGLDNYSDARIAAAQTTVESANTATAFQGLSPSDAVEAAVTVAREDTVVSARLGCPGDCDGADGTRINDLISAVRITLEAAPVSTCPAVDSNADGRVTINELIEAVSIAIGSCSL